MWDVVVIWSVLLSFIVLVCLGAQSSILAFDSDLVHG